MMRSSTKTIRLGKKLGKGGEGVVYELRDNPDFVAKIYYPKKLPPVQKLRLMVANQPGDPTKALNHVSIVWITGLVYNKRGKIVGCVMPKISEGYPIDTLYNLKKREQAFPDFTWKDIHRTVCSLAAAVAAVHAKGYVIGNFNEKNILVQPTGLVTLLNTDSFHVSNPEGESFRGSVGKPEYLAPELQGRPPEMTELREEHDRFTLAVIIFRLLMEGTHPFEGSGEPLELAKRIRQGLFPYSVRGNAPVQPPTSSVPFEVLHPEIQQLLHACFVEGHFHANRRPQATDWVNVLQQTEAELVQCTANQRHFYVQTQTQCPWCEQNQIVKEKDSPQEQARSPGTEEQRILSQTPVELFQQSAIDQQTHVHAALSRRSRSRKKRNLATARRTPDHSLARTGDDFWWVSIGAIVLLVVAIFLGEEITRYFAQKPVLDSRNVTIKHEWNYITSDSIPTDVANAVQITSENGCVVVGSGSKWESGFIVKLNAKGKQVWNHTFNKKVAYDIKTTLDGGYVVAGIAKNISKGIRRVPDDAWVCKLDGQGKQVWSHTFDQKTTYDIKTTSDGGCIVAGSFLKDRSKEAWILKFDAHGQQIWEHIFNGGLSYNIAHAIQITPDGGYIIAGVAYSRLGSRKTWVLKLDEQGQQVWNRTFGDNEMDEVYEIRITPGNDYIVAGITTAKNVGKRQVWVIKLNICGEKMWDRIFGFKSSALHQVKALQLTPDGGYVLAGSTFTEKNWNDAWILKLNAQGNYLWDCTFGVSRDDDSANAIAVTPDGGYIVAGFIGGRRRGLDDAWVFKFKPDN